MICILSCTNRQGSKTLSAAKKVFEIYQKKIKKPSAVLIDLKTLPLNLIKKPYQQAQEIKKEIDTLNKSKGVVLVLPEYNGSYPGIFKYFLDHWDETKTFKAKPFFLIGIASGQSQGHFAVNHIQSVLLHRKSYIFPECIFISARQIKKTSLDKNVLLRIEKQLKRFCQFTKKLNSI